MRTDEDLSINSLINLRVQYMDDANPFNCSGVFPLPSRARILSFVITTPLSTQLGALLRLLGAPQRVSMIRNILDCRKFIKLKLLLALKNFLRHKHFFFSISTY